MIRFSKWVKMFLLVLIIPLLPVSLSAAGGKLSGYMFGDFYYFASHHDSIFENQNGFWFRRIYFTYDYKIDENFTTRLRFEMASPGDLETRGKIFPFVKDAYLKYKQKGIGVIFGLSPTPTWDVIEKIWGYRSVEKTPLDLQKFGSSRDLGIALKGKIQRGIVRYHLMLANGAGTKSETNREKKVYGSLGISPKKGLIFELYGDWEEGKGHTDNYTYQVFLGLTNPFFRLGLQYAQKTYQMEPDTSSNYPIASIFTTFSIRKNLTLLFRFDHLFEPSPMGEKISYLPFSSQAKANLFVFGLDLHPNRLVHIIPNVEMVQYQETNGIKPDSDMVTRITVFYKFK